MEAEWRLFPVIKEMGDTESLCVQELHRAFSVSAPISRLGKASQGSKGPA